MIRFDTRDKKPKVYNIAVLSVIFAIILLILSLMGVEKHTALISSCFCLYLALVIFLLFRAFVRQIQYNPYSYNTIYYFGFAIFLIAMLIYNLVILVSQIRYPEVYDVRQTLTLVNGSAQNFMILTVPFILAFSIAMCISNISLIRHEGYRVVNMLGIILSVLLVGSVAFVWRIDYYATGSQREVMMHDLFVNLMSSVYLYIECMLIGVIVADMIAARYQPEYDKDFLIILGCGIRKDGTPTPLLRGRIDRAIDFYKKQKAATGKELTFVTSGGQGPNEVISESRCMKNYLLEQGIPEERIIMEDQSTDTFENMKFSKEKILAVNPEGKVAFSTTNYHVFRSGLFARRVKMRAQGMGAHTKWYFWPNAAVREFVGLLTQHRVKQIVILSSMIIFYTVLTIILYS